MANKVIKGLTVEIGGDTTKLGKALEDVEQKSRSLSGELGSINKLLKLDPSNVELLSQKQKVLADAISNTEDKLDKLKEAERQVQKQFEKGEASEEQVRALQREIIATTNKLGSYERAVKETSEAIDKLGNNTDDAADDMKDLSENEDKAEKSADDLDNALDGLGTGLKVVAALAAAAGAAIFGIVESTQEYRTAMGKLDAAFTSAGKSTEEAKETYKELQSVLGDTDQAVEASAHLAELVDNEKDLKKWTNICKGVYAKFGASLPIESLTEAANETAKTGQVTGALADALNWAIDPSETFGLTLKDNIEFTELSAKELAELTEQQVEEYEATKEQYDAIKAYNKMVGEATTVEDRFNIALANCTTEQERQQLITETLTKAYSQAATEYEKTNKAIIEANKANEEWNATLAEVGAELQPTATAIKNLGTEILKNAKEPLKDVADFIGQNVIPALSSMVKWISDNGPIVKGAIVTAAAVLATYKAATIAATISQEGLKGAILGTTAAEKALQLVQKATPWGLAATAVVGVVTALTAYAVATDDAMNKTDVLTTEERELMAAANETAQAFRDQQAATAENASGITAQMEHVQSLANELMLLADASGQVEEADRARAEFILNELNEALGTEYTMTDGVIQQYEDLKNNINAVIQAKTVSALLEAHNADYVAAIEAERNALQNLVLAEKDYKAQLAETQRVEAEAAAARAALNEKTAAAKTEADYRALSSEANRVYQMEQNAEKERASLAKKEKAYNEAASNYGNYSDTILNYEEAQTAALEGNYERAKELLVKKGGSYDTYSDKVDEATREAVDALYKEAIDAGIAAERIKRNFEKGVDGYTEEMVKEAEEGYEAALEEWANAKIDAENVGKDLGMGLNQGLENKRSSLVAKARNLVKSIIDTMRSEADSHSPSRKMIAFGEDMGEGAAIGVENKTARLDEAAREQVEHLLGTYSEAGDVSGQDVFQTIQSRDAAQQMASYQATAGSTADRLDRILEAIERGQVIMLDGDQLVGATADRMDSELGQRRALAARGAI